MPLSNVNSKAWISQCFCAVWLKPPLFSSIFCSIQYFCKWVTKALFVCVEVLRPSQPNGVMSSAVSLPNVYWAGLVLWAVNQYCAHSFARNWQLPFLNQRKRENERRKYFMINPHERMLPTFTKALIRWNKCSGQSISFAIVWAMPSKKACKMHRFRFSPRMCKVSYGHLLSIDTFYSIKWFC